MVSPHVKRFLCEYLQGQRSADETKEILCLIDSTGALDAEFDSVLSAVAQKIPGLALDLDKLLSHDEIECDPLISQGNLALLRLDAIYHQAFQAWTKSGLGLHKLKRITKPENPATYSDRTEKHERTEETYPPHAQLINQIVNITLSAFRVQATITYRRDQLTTGKQSGQSVSRDATRSASPPQQTSHSPSDIIDENEIFNPDFDDLSQPIKANMPLLIRGINKLGLLKGFNELGPLTKTHPVGFAVRTKTNHTNNSSPRSPLSASPRETSPETTNTESPGVREEELVTSEVSTSYASPRETYSHFPTEPAYHQRE